jgi:hypothetical protein
MSARNVARGLSLISLWCVAGIETAAANASVQVEMAVPLEDVRAALEAAIPQKIERLGATEFHGDVGVRYGAWRGAINVAGVGNALRVGMRIEFAAWGCLRINKPWPLRGSFCQQIASCGYGNQPHPVVDVWVNITGKWAADWSVAASATLEFTTLRPCNVTFVNYDATSLAINELRTKLQEQAAKVRDRLQLRSVVDRAWGQVRPLPLGNDTWLVWSPTTIRAQPIQFQASAITGVATITLDASVVTSASPPAMPAFPSLTLVTGP